MSALDDMRRETVRVEAMAQDVFVNVVAEAHRSIQTGSVITGAPGQPVDTGNLSDSWQVTFVSPTQAAIDTNVEYALAVEDGVGPHGPRTYGKSGTGGSHSVKLTVAGMQRIVDAEVAKVLR